MPIIRNEPKVIHKTSDNFGNFFIVEREPKYGNWKIYVHLKTEKYRRMIGEVDTENFLMFVIRDKSQHLHREMKAYGFNYKAIDTIANLKHILIREEDGDIRNFYLIPIAFIKQSSVIKNFSKSGFELQYFLRVEYLTRFKVPHKFERGRMKIK